jgi:alkyldihydroxyacetonephosphate synthase
VEIVESNSVNEGKNMNLNEKTQWQDLINICGIENVFLSDEILDFHSYDTWPAAIKWKLQGKQPYRPDIVVQPHFTSQVSQVVHWASSNSIPVTPWGLGSSVTGASIPLKGGISLDMSAMNRILAFEPTSLLVRVQAGKRGLDLEQELNEKGFSINHSPQSLDRSTVGGWVSTRASGQFSSRSGSIEDLVLGLTVVLPNGEVIETPLAPRAAVGPDLKQLFIGAEGSMGVITEVTLKIFPIAEHRIFETLAFPTIEAGLNAMRRIMQAGLRPFLVRFYDTEEARHAMKDDGFSNPVMFLGFEGIKVVAEAEYSAGLKICLDEGGSALGPGAALAWMDRRFDFSTIEKLVLAPGGLAETIEVAHFWDGILETYEALKVALAPYASEVLGHFSHVYPQGTSLYIILLGQVEDDAASEANIMKIWETSMQICLEKNAALSHHHGVGIARLPFIRAQLGSAMNVLERVKYSLDPENIMNPGKLDLNG